MTSLQYLRAVWMAPLLLASACSDLGTPTDSGGTGAAAGRAEGTKQRVLPVELRAFGRSYGEWSAAWWQWAYGIPVPTNPLFDETGALCGNGQTGKVWFLAGVFNASGTAVPEQLRGTDRKGALRANPQWGVLQRRGERNH